MKAKSKQQVDSFTLKARVQSIKVAGLWAKHTLDEQTHNKLEQNKFYASKEEKDREKKEASAKKEREKEKTRAVG